MKHVWGFDVFLLSNYGTIIQSNWITMGTMKIVEYILKIAGEKYYHSASSCFLFLLSSPENIYITMFSVY